MRGLFFAAILLCAAPLAQASTLFEDLGGREKLTAVAGNLVDRASTDPQIGHFFDETDLPRLKVKLTDMFCHLSGEKRAYRGANMHNAHSDFEIHVGDFNRLVELLQFAMDDADIPFSTQNRLLALLAPMESQIVNH